MEDNAHAVECYLDKRTIANVAAKEFSFGVQELGLVAGMNLWNHSVKHANLVPLLSEGVYQMRTDESRASSHQDLLSHVVRSFTVCRTENLYSRAESWHGLQS